MTTKRYILAVCILAALLPCCAYLPAFTNEEYARRRHGEMEQQYDPYRQRNTIESYREFIAKFPDNMYVSTSRAKIDDLEFEPYEKADTIAAYTQFVAQYPRNRHAVTARNRIDQANVKDSERIDTIEGYRQFLEKHPDNIFAQTSQDRLQDLEFRELDKELQQKYGFDLLLYRLNVRRLQKELAPAGGINLADFTLFASVEQVKGKKYFHTHLIYGSELSRLDGASKEAPELFFTPIISRLLVYLDKKFANKKAIDGFSFDVSFSDYRFHGDKVVLLEYYFPAASVQLFAQNRLDASQLLAQAEIVVPDRSARLAAKTAAKHEQAPAVRLDGPDIMKTVAQKSSRADDFIIAWTFESTSKYGRGMYIKGLSKRKNYRGKDGFISKELMCMEIPNYPGFRLLRWNRVDKQNPVVWWRWQRGDPSRAKPPETKDNEFRHLFLEENLLEDETHELLGEEEFEGRQCFIVQSIPKENNQGYAKRITRIWRDTFSPLKIDYYAEAGGNIVKTIHAEMDNKYGEWTIKKAVLENFQTGDTSVFTIDDLKVNVGLEDLEFTPGALTSGGG